MMTDYDSLFSRKIALASCETPTIMSTTSDESAQIVVADLVVCLTDVI